MVAEVKQGDYSVRFPGVNDGANPHFASKPATVTVGLTYNIWVAGTEVTGNTATHSGTGWSFAPATNTLTLNGFTSTVCHAGSMGIAAVLCYEGTSDLNIQFTGTNTLDASDVTTGGKGIYSNSGKIILNGSGTLNLKGKNTDNGAGVFMNSSAELIINSGIITAEGHNGFSGKTTINGGDVTATATGDKEAALNGYLTNAIPGKGWTDAALSDPPKDIPISDTSRNMWGYYKVHFPHIHTFTGYSLSEDGATITATCNVDGCPLDDGNGNHTATLTISAAGGTYDGMTPYGATITDENGIQGTATVGYYKATDDDQRGESLSAAPLGAGKYWAEITLGEGDAAKTAHVVYTVAKATPAELTADVAANGVTIYYTDEAATANANSGYQLATTNAENTEGSESIPLTAILDGEQTQPTYYVRTAETDNYLAGSWVAMQLSARPAAPTNLSFDNASNPVAEDGAINHTTTEMEYRADGD